MSNATRRRTDVRDPYLELVRAFPLTSIRDDSHLKQSQKVLDSLFSRQPLKEGEEEYLEALSDLIGVYESQHVEFDVPGDAAILGYLMKLKNVNQSQLAADTEISKSIISEVLSSKRVLTRVQVAKLARYFCVGQGTFSIEAET